MSADDATRSGTQRRKFPHLKRPPIAEVVCGFLFAPIPKLDAFEFGVYWDKRRDEYPDKEMRLGLIDDAKLEPSPRAWLISPDDGPLLQQLQNDRFYLNWRRRDDELYPRFSDRADQPGLRTAASSEFQIFSEFCAARPTIGVRPRVAQIELTKVDSFERGRDWNELEELDDLLPITRAITATRQSNQIRLSMSEREELHAGWLKVQINSSNDARGDLSAIRLETRVSLTVGPELGVTAAFEQANARLNDVFFRLVPNASESFGTAQDEGDEE